MSNWDESLDAESGLRTPGSSRSSSTEKCDESEPQRSGTPAPPSGQAPCSYPHLQVAALQFCATCRPLMKLKRKKRKGNAFPLLTNSCKLSSHARALHVSS